MPNQKRLQQTLLTERNTNNTRRKNVKNKNYFIKNFISREKMKYKKYINHKKSKIKLFIDPAFFLELIYHIFYFTFI